MSGERGAAGLWETLAAPWRSSLDEAWAAYRAGSVPIGAAVVDGAGAIVARGRNRIFEAVAAPPFLARHRLAHAEMNALVALDHARTDPRDCALYTTTEPCPLCTGAIRMIRLREVYYAARDPLAGSLSLLDATPFMRRQGIRVFAPERADLETLIAALHIEFSLRVEPASGERIAAHWATDLAAGVELGRSLHRSGELYRLGQAGASTEEMVRYLDQFLPLRS
jgi:tRNA(adenine34) deaminase